MIRDYNMSEKEKAHAFIDAGVMQQTVGPIECCIIYCHEECKLRKQSRPLQIMISQQYIETIFFFRI